jgi:transposase
MSSLFWPTDEQMARLEPCFPQSHGKPRVDDRSVLSGIIFTNRNGLRWCGALRECGPAQDALQRLAALEREARFRPHPSQTKGGMNTKLHAVTDSVERPIRVVATAGQVGDDVGA